jgi:two-component system phosphate regulon response regulator OmpR
LSSRILIIDDDERLGRMLGTYLGASGFTVEQRLNGASGFAAGRRGFDAVILDGMLPDLDGLEVLRRLRAESDVPVLMLTARGDPTDRIVGLELGADDYLPKPFEPRELLARLRAVLRRRVSSATPSAPLRFGRLELDREGRQVTLGGEPRPLTAHQFDILRVLAESAGRILSREQISERVTGEEGDGDRSVDVHISRIRAAIEDDPKEPRRVLTVRGSGYLFSSRQD